MDVQSGFADIYLFMRARDEQIPRDILATILIGKVKPIPLLAQPS
jgi:hypothetical protein